MRLSDQFRFVRQNMKKNKSRLFMTVLATAMGCAFLIVLASVGFGLQKSIVDELAGAAIGIVVSYALSIAVNAALPVLIESFVEEKLPAGFRFSLIPPVLTVLAAAISLGVAVLSGARPARRATRIDVLRALRRDV